MKRLIALLKDAGVWKEEYEQELLTIEEQCEICKRYAKTPPRPVVSLPMASQFNEKVAMDLKQWNGRWILHMIDMWSRYTVSVFIDRKKTTGVIEKMMTNWIGIFGVMGTILTDNGGEFSSDEMREVASILNVKVYTTAGESPFQNGLCERAEQNDNIETPDTNETGIHETRYTNKNNEVSRKEKKNCFSELLSTSKETIPQMENIQAKIIPNLKENDKIQYKLPNSNTWTKATVLSKAGKTTGKNKHWYNVQDDVDEDKKSVDLDKVEWEKVTGDSDENEIGVNMTKSSFLNDEEIAKQTELSKLHNFDTYEECDDIGQNVLSTRWVITTKDNQTKARLVVRGFEEEFSMQRDSPTVGKGMIKIFLSITASMNWIVKTTDIKSAFLQGKLLDRDVFLKPPKESNSEKGKIWRLKHCLYGLKDGARQFYLSVREELLSLGCKQCNLDPAVFVKHTDQRLSGIICCHVDDFLHSGDENFEEVMRKLRTRFVAGKN
ncbi:unnamed protein product [Mytilus edulis]|uniref:Integrase catalytic domain-containing protein n=1 Tax=Mytilus edulis TaxID=6550 RepID=A0A8S3U026_MYTED|nr:unnamed protein product [Mytilus edulis]